MARLLDFGSVDRTSLRRRTTRRAAVDSITMESSTLSRSIMNLRCVSVLLMITLSAVGILLAHTSDTRCSTAVHTVTSGDNSAYLAGASKRQQESRNVDESSHAIDTATLISPVPPQTNFSGILARSFEPWEHPLPCFEPEQEWQTIEVQNSPADSGFLFVKPYKTGSSTSSGINLRIARNVAIRQDTKFGICRCKAMH